MEVIKLIGVLIVIVGFILKLDTLAVVVVAGLATGLVAGMSPMQILETLGTAFITNRTATLFILTLPVIGICERNGLKDKAVDFITSLRNATTGRLIAIWQIIRTLASAFSLRIGGHPQFIRPLINPMAQAAAVVQYGKLDEETIKQLTGGEEIKARNLYETATTFLPQFTLWLSCNDLPTVSDKSLFASDRVRVIEFNRHFTEAEQDKNLKNEFQTQEAMQGIFAWLVAGYFKYKRFGLKMSPAMRKVVNQYERDNDLCLQFLEERCEQAEGVNTRSKSLFDAYKIWCKSNGYFACSAKRFNADMETHPEWHGGKVVYQGYPVYKNLRLKGAS